MNIWYTTYIVCFVQFICYTYYIYIYILNRLLFRLYTSHKYYKYRSTTTIVYIYIYIHIEWYITSLYTIVYTPSYIHHNVNTSIYIYIYREFSFSGVINQRLLHALRSLRCIKSVLKSHRHSDSYWEHTSSLRSQSPKALYHGVLKWAAIPGDSPF